ncbi:MAG: TRAP transporter substrate-binding protein [Alphaproteobacteria bacterium]|nr:MAG: TRAP transporter substrate-binding protein [Alphaproteobacteria bacterium]
MDRRKVLSGAGLLATAGVTGAALVGLSQTRSKPGANNAGNASDTLASPAIVTGKRTLKLVTTWPKNFPGLGMTPERIAERVTQMTDGTLTVKVLAAGEFVGAFEAFDAVSTGAADMYHGAEYYWQGKSKAFNFFTTVPFGMTTLEHQAWVNFGGGQALWDELSGQFNIRAFMSGNTGNQMGGWFNKEINTLEDFKGLKMRMPGLGGEVLRRMGASAIALPGGEIYSSLQSGAIDATEWVGPWNDLAFGFYEITKYYYYPGFHEPGAQLAFGINLDVWNSLTQQQQVIVQQACAAENNWSASEFKYQDTKALKTLIEDHGVQMRTFSDEILMEMERQSSLVVKETGEGDELSRRIYESYIAARRSGMEIAAYNYEPYLRARRLRNNF